MDIKRQRILKILIYEPGLKFNQIWKKIGGESNKFAYYIKTLKDDGYIKKIQEKYTLTRKGKQLANQLFSNTELNMPIVGVLVIVFNSKKQVLCYKRLKQPSYGYYAFPGGKMTSEEYPIESAKRKLAKDCGLDCDLKLEGMFISKTYVDSELSYNNQLFIFSGNNPSGELIKENYKGEHIWINPTKVPKTQKYPEFNALLEVVESKEFKVVEMDRFKEEDRFISSNFVEK